MTKKRTCRICAPDGIMATEIDGCMRESCPHAEVPCTCPVNSWGRVYCQEQSGNGVNSYCQWERRLEQNAELEALTDDHAA